jgi:hypothetical protein
MVEGQPATHTPEPPPCRRCGVAIPLDGPDVAERLAEAAGWHEFHSLIDLLTVAEANEPGYFREGWSVRDLVGHVGAWLAEAGQLFEQMGVGTYAEGALDVDEANARFFELMRGLTFETVHAQAWTARWWMLRVWSKLPDPTPATGRWLATAGGQHYAEHLPRLQEWTAELIARRERAHDRTGK